MKCVKNTSNFSFAFIRNNQVILVWSSTKETNHRVLVNVATGDGPHTSENELVFYAYLKVKKHGGSWLKYKHYTFNSESQKPKNKDSNK